MFICITARIYLNDVYVFFFDKENDSILSGSQSLFSLSSRKRFDIALRDFLYAFKSIFFT